VAHVGAKVPRVADPLYFPVIKTMRGLFAVLGLRLDVRGAENLPETGGAVVAINHTSFLDFIFAGIPADDAGHRYIRFMAKDAVFKHPISGPLMRGMKHIPVDRSAGAGAFDAAVDALRRGELVGVFPEATMSRSFDIKDFKTGAARMAVAADVPLIPEIVFGGQRMYSYDHKDFSRGNAVSVTVGEPMHPTAQDDPEAVTADLRARMIRMLDDVVEQYPDRPSGTEDDWWLPARFGGSAPTLEQAAVIESEVKARKAARRQGDSH
jgi:1-acyl-sn-glycerol-3-phosphate acyltransferase